MKKLKLELEYCYGIKKLEKEFNFQKYGDVFAIYAPNGVMKTSLAKTFNDLKSGVDSKDRIWEGNQTKRVIEDDSGTELTPESIFVIEPYIENYHSDRISTLLVNDKLRKSFEAIHKEIDEKAEILVAELKVPTGMKSGIREEFAKSFMHDPNGFFPSLKRVQSEVEEHEETPLGNVLYTVVFNPKVEILLKDSDFIRNIKNYIEKYEELLNRSTFFRKGVFTHNNASDIAKNLKTNGFFKAEHSVYLRIGGEKTEVSSLKELESAIQKEKDIILTDDSLKEAFEAIDKQLQKNADLKKFRICLQDNQILLEELANPERLRQKLWIEYLIRSKGAYQDLLSAFDDGKDKISKIVDEAKNQTTKWAEVIGIFNERFSVPFVVRMDNQEDVILKSEAPVICFDFLSDPDDRDSAVAPIDEVELKGVLSNGERRALYILNIIFEVEARKSAGQNTLFVVDDIADSFDYKNKYAIIEYLMDVSAENGFQQLILSHNFDFYRTVSSRLRLSRESRMLASKENGKIVLQEEIYQKHSPFHKWRQHLDNNSMLIASIPFLRNLAEFSGQTALYSNLTSLLHVKPDTNQITVGSLETWIKSILHDQSQLVLQWHTTLVKDLIYQAATTIGADTSETADLEHKVVLSIAIRLKAEDYMIGQINDDPFWRGIKSNQTVELIKRFKSDFPLEKEKIKLLDQVNLMTPENIHLNSFMYEPILDLSAQHLKKLFTRVSQL